MQKVELINREVSYAVREEIKYLRAGLQFAGTDKKVLLFTSALAGEGKTTISILLAKSLTDLGKKVLLIDSDMRRSHMKNELADKHAAKLGLSHFLSGQCSLSDALIATDNDNLFMLIAGPIPPNPAELLSNASMNKLIEWGKREFDYVIIDSAPIGTVADAAILTSFCDGSIMVLEAGKIPYKMAQDVKQQLEISGCPILGVILNKIDVRSGKKYYNRYYYKKYAGEYGGEYEAAEKRAKKK